MYLVDTNVMLAASAVSELSNQAVRAMPSEIELREMIYDWLSSFEQSEQSIVLDEEGLVRDEYERNMPYNFLEQEYGMQVLQYKLDRNQVVYVPINSIEANGEHIAVLDPVHEALVSDREDRKWAACALAAQILFDQVPPIVYGAETDWFIAEEQLRGIGLCFHRLLPDEWYSSKVAS
ncbi:TPA: hypothetical protein R8G72_002054 [Citrobacter youngae]|mgnify:FL=1|uniref:hypothetical protein n=1 Tax=Enterobacteriaceae TaxID=543 RepID=UPI00062284D3|nr:MULTISPECIES: hypothetical protein [Enterobacteriaceae]KKF71563.1 hypothetical protein XU19_01565 [Vibrio parahaemolyticus]MBS5934791.1 hypothetical protein [Clostridiales bacterium]HDS7953858.1 hypothetical protein [Klebsiella pneumoniae subsp. pneumoniae]HDS9400776.1 hypothetical protein [Klebsiella quasipneumoniae subsp. quasipneumoniae]HEE0141137.1 hypothetical protein [Citrobacter youngae]